MDSERWKRVDHLLQAALACPPGERSGFLRRECGADEELEREVRSLLASQRQAGSFLESPAMEVAARAIALEHSAETPESGSLAGQTISHYRVVEKLGYGGMGVVWKARDTRLDRFVALKFLPAAKMTDPERKRRFVQEAKAASALNHPHIVTIYDIGQAEGADFIAMEFVPGEALDRLIPRKGLRVGEALKYAAQIADALGAAHAAGIVHRDLKPGNIMVTGDGAVKVLDFGLAKLTEQIRPAGLTRSETLANVETSEGVIVGTVSYMSPEQAEGKKVDARTDIFSFGAVLYEMITGRRAFAGDSVVSILSAILRDDPKPAAEIVHGLPRDLDEILMRCLRKDPSRRYQHAADLKIDLQQAEEELASSSSAMRGEMAGGRSGNRWWWIAAAACAALSFAVGWRLHGPPPAPPQWKLTRLTADAGLSNFAALSPDGKLVAYSSDRTEDGGRDLYIRQVAGGQPIRLTSDGTGNRTPDFSPDGSKIVFRSNREGGGIYEIPAFGGDTRLVARDGLNPKYSPDGSNVAYWVGSESIATVVPKSGTVWVVPVAGGQPQRVGSNFSTARYPIWSPDGKHLLIVGYAAEKAFDSSAIDWWLVDLNGSGAIKTGAHNALLQAGLQPRAERTPVPSIAKPGCWLAGGDTVVFSMISGDTHNLWEIGLSGAGKVSGRLKRLTTGAGDEVDPSCSAGGAIAFTNAETRRNLWSLPIDLDRGTARGALERITHGPAWRENPSFTRDGRYVAFVSDQSDQFNIWKRDLATGKEWSVAPSPYVQRYPMSTPSGDRIAFSVYEKGKRAVYLSAPGVAPEKLCEGCLRPTDWSRDERTLLVHGGNPFQINALDVASHGQTPILKHASFNLLYGQYSPDNRWVSFTARIQPNRGRITVAPLDGPKPVPESAWVPIVDAGADDFAGWSPDGKTLYFTSAADGYSCMWARRFDASSRRPVGDAFAVQHFHGRVSFGHGSWAAAGGRIGLALVEVTGNVWMMSPAGAR